MKARVLLLLAVAAIAVAESDRHVADTVKALNQLRAQQAKWIGVLKGKSGYIMHTASGQHFLDHNETLSQKVCGEKKPHLLGQDEASLPPQFRGQRRGQNKKHLLGQDEASLPPQRRGQNKKHLLGQDEASLPPQRRGQGKKHLLGQDEASLPPQFRGQRRGQNKQHLLGQDEASLPPQFRGQNNKEHLLGQDEASLPPQFRGRQHDKRHRRSAPKMVGQDRASLPPAYNPVSHSVSDVFGVLKNVLQKSCAVTVQYHKQMGYPMHFNVTSCQKFPALVKHISLPPVTLVAQKSHIASKVCSKPKPMKHTARVLVQHFQALAILSLPKVNPAPISAAAKKSIKNVAVLLRNKAVGPAPKKILNEAKKAAAVAAKKVPIPFFMPGPVVLPAAKPATPVKKQHPRAKLGRKTGTNPAVFTDIEEKKKPEHHDRMPEHHDRQPEQHGDHHGHHQGGHHGDHHGDDHHHGGDRWMFMTDDGKFSHFWHSKARQFRHFVMKHPWVLPTSFAILGLLTSAIILLAVHYARKRRAARSQDGHTLLVNEDKKALIDDDDQQTASVYVNQVTA